MNIFAANADGMLAIVEKNRGERTLCDLCLNAPPIGRVSIFELYEQAAKAEFR